MLLSSISLLPKRERAEASSSRLVTAFTSSRDRRRSGPDSRNARNAAHKRFICSAQGTHTPWRVAKHVMPCFIDLANGIEDAIRREFGPGIQELKVPDQYHWATVEGFTMENRFCHNELFRKTHMELAVGGKGLQILHFVMYPYAEYALPMYSLDLVAFGPRVTLAIADVCPVTADLSLPPAYNVVAGLKEKHLGHLPPRPVPDWGTRCLSNACACISPEDPESVQAFVDFALELFAAHLKIAKEAKPSASEEEARTAPLAGAEVKATLRAQQSYCSAQLENMKTRRVLEQFFGNEFAAGYMEGVMFDVSEKTPVRRGASAAASS